MKCPNCGYVSFSEAEKCKKCGALLPREAQRPAAPAPALESIPLQRDLPPPKAAGDLPLKPEAPPPPQPVSRPHPEPEPLAPPAALQAAQARPKPPEAPAAPERPAADTEWKREIKRKVQEHKERATPPEEQPVLSPPPAPTRVADHPSPRPSQVRTAGPYDTTMEMGPHEPRHRPAVAPRAAPQPHKPDQIPLFEEPAQGVEDFEPGAGSKFSAALIDTVLITIPWAVALFSTDRILDIGVGAVLARGWLPFTLFFLILHALYHVLFLSILGETPGLGLLRMHLSSDGRVPSGKSILYSLLAAVSLAAIGAGFIWAVFDPDHRSWPELAAGGRITYKNH